MSYSITHICHTTASIGKVFECLSTIEGLKKWWTNETEGNPQKEGLLNFKFGGKYENLMKVISYQSSKNVEWLVVEYLPDWVDTKIQFQLDINENQTRIRFQHIGFQKQNNFFAQCSFSWAKYLISLRQLAETGIGEPYNPDKSFD